MMTSDTSKRSYYENDMQVQEIFFVLMCDTEANFDFGLKLSPLSNLAIKRSQHHLARQFERGRLNDSSGTHLGSFRKHNSSSPPYSVSPRIWLNAQSGSKDRIRCVCSSWEETDSNCSFPVSIQPSQTCIDHLSNEEKRDRFNRLDEMAIGLITDKWKASH
ncbi:hypothetical protein RRG08_053048 [Elysia crispata]|uniref:Uncharacterized protein n=1 Tax=Elysia crispata TaxID=231223 RepID=A0AAE1CLM9_9GAST|nr:hypothetical protein RRG08_053048 [Elysia crispata]